MNLEQSTDLVLQAVTPTKIATAIHILSCPASYGIKLDMTDYQTSLMIEQLNINDCNLAINNTI